MTSNKPKIVVIVGPTASGKSALAIRLAKKLRGEVISADSRQVYKHLDIGTGKITREEMQGVPHHMLDVANPKRQYDVFRYIEIARKIIDDIVRRGKVPIICGGTAFYIYALLGEITPAPAPANPKLRKQLEKKSTSELFKMLRKLDPARARVIDKNNKVRLIRSIEIAKALGAMPKVKISSPYQTLKIGIVLSDAVLRKNITIRLFVRIREGMIAEARRLHRQGLSWKRMEELGLEYRYLARYLQNKISKTEMISQLETTIWHYAKRQKTWFKKDKEIKWFNPRETAKIEKAVKKFV